MNLARHAAYVLALAMVSASAIALPAVCDAYQIVVKKWPIYPESGLVLKSLPAATPTWTQVGADQPMDPDVEKVLGTQNHVSRRYVHKNGKVALNFHAAYYTGGIDAVPHVPDRCFVGGGMQQGKFFGNIPLQLDVDGRWLPDDAVPEELLGRIFRVRSIRGPFVRLPRDPHDIRLRTMKFLDGETPVYAGYFFVANGGTVCLAEEVRLLAFDLTSYYAYYMKIQVTSIEGISSGEELALYGQSLVGELLGDLMLCTPDWVAVERGEYPADNPKRARPESRSKERS